MKRVVLAAALVAVLGGTASAGGTYIGVGVGTIPAVSEDTERLDADSRALKGILGMRWGQWSIEGSIGGNTLTRNRQSNLATGSAVFDPFGDFYVLGASGKFNLPLGNNFEAFGRLGVNHMIVRGENEDNDASGNGLQVGAGFEYKLNLGVAGGSIFVDYTINRAAMTGDNNPKLEYDLTTRTWMLGLTIGI
jgi:opacity protein-like surface antigen